MDSLSCINNGGVTDEVDRTFSVVYRKTVTICKAGGRVSGDKVWVFPTGWSLLFTLKELREGFNTGGYDWEKVGSVTCGKGEDAWARGEELGSRSTGGADNNLRGELGRE